jgi:hypothetical protein
MYLLSIIRNSILYMRFMYMYVSRIIFRMVLSTWLHTTLLYEGLYNVFALPNLKLLPSSSPKLYLFNFKKLFWCFLKTNFHHNNFAKLHCSHMTLDRSKILLKHEQLCLLPFLKISAHLTSWNERSCYFLKVTSNWDLNTKWLTTCS